MDEDLGRRLAGVNSPPYAEQGIQGYIAALLEFLEGIYWD